MYQLSKDDRLASTQQLVFAAMTLSLSSLQRTYYEPRDEPGVDTLLAVV
jgi:hypothetical protein